MTRVAQKHDLHKNELIESGEWGSLERTRVPGGWIYRDTRFVGEEGEERVAVAICFVPEVLCVEVR
jgi:hypothetical protein